MKESEESCMSELKIVDEYQSCIDAAENGIESDEIVKFVVDLFRKEMDWDFLNDGTEDNPLKIFPQYQLRYELRVRSLFFDIKFGGIQYDGNTRISMQAKVHNALLSDFPVDKDGKLNKEALSVLQEAVKQVYPGREKTYLARILQDNHEKCKSCKILAENANLARI